MPVAAAPEQLRPWALLRGVSRSFYLSIRLLPAGMREPVAVGYLLARASDTVADTTSIGIDQRRSQLKVLADLFVRAGPDRMDRARALAASFAPAQQHTDERALI